MYHNWKLLQISTQATGALSVARSRCTWIPQSGSLACHAHSKPRRCLLVFPKKIAAAWRSVRWHGTFTELMATARHAPQLCEYIYIFDAVEALSRNCYLTYSAYVASVVISNIVIGRPTVIYPLGKRRIK